MDNPETLATLDTQDEDKQNKKHNAQKTKKMSNTNPVKTRGWNHLLGDETICSRSSIWFSQFDIKNTTMHFLSNQYISDIFMEYLMCILPIRHALTSSVHCLVANIDNQ
jgi:hypothetical protein